MHVFIFFTVFTLVWLGVFFLLVRRFSHPLGSEKAKRIARWALIASIAVIAIAPLFYRLFPHYNDTATMRWFFYLSFSTMGVLSLLLTFVMLWWPVEKVALKAANIKKDRFDLNRRLFLQRTANLGILTATAGVSVVAKSNRMDGPKIVTVPMKMDTPLSRPLKLVQITDVHIGPILDGSFVQQLVEEINNQKPDIVAITGDLVDGRVAQLGEHIAKFQGLKTTYGTYFVTGNHEYYSKAEEWIPFLEKIGITVLDNDSRLIEHHGFKMQLAGIPDYRMARDSNAQKAYASLSDPVNYRLLLAHQPKSCFAAERAGFDLMICGHTHGGQYWPATEIIKWVQPFVQGMGKLNNMQVYVNPGTGFWGPPMRLGTEAEITVFEFS